PPAVIIGVLDGVSGGQCLAEVVNIPFQLFPALLICPDILVLQAKPVLLVYLPYFSRLLPLAYLGQFGYLMAFSIAFYGHVTQTPYVIVACLGCTQIEPFGSLRCHEVAHKDVPAKNV